MSVSVSGTVPDTIFENAAPGDWVGHVAFPVGVLGAGIAGPDSAYFTASFNFALRILTIRPAIVFDAEAFPPGHTFRLDLIVRVGSSWSVLKTAYPITLLDLDDTPPQDLRFAAGGVVLANDVGGEIGELAAEDPDSPGPLTFRVAWPDSAFFEVAGRTLRLRQGVDLQGQAGVREVAIEVSDGRNDAAFLLPVTILQPGPAAPYAVQDGSILADTLTGSAAADAIFAHAGADLVLGLAGADSLSAGAGDDTMEGGEGADTLRGQDGRDRLQGAAGADRLYGDAGDDWLTGGEGDDRVDGGEGADTLDGGAGNDWLIGWRGDDVYLLRSAGQVAIEQPGHGIDEVVVSWSLAMPAAVERIRFRYGAGDLVGVGGAGADTILGNDGHNTLSGGAGVDRLEGGPGHDLLLGEAGADSLLGGDGNDTLHGGEGAEAGYLSGEAGHDRLEGGAGADTLLGGAGADVLLGAAAADSLDGGAEDDLLAGGEGDDRLSGAEGNDLLTGGAGADRLAGDAGADTLLGGEGSDLLQGGTGADLLEGGAGADTLEGGPGTDRLQGGAGDDLLRGGGGTGDVLRGDDGADTLDGAAGDRLPALLLGGPGDDLFWIDSRADQVVEAAGSGQDTVWAILSGGGTELPAQVEDLVLMGAALFGRGNGLGNRLTGNGQDNLLLGEAGSDTLQGGLGDDTLGGGAGADRFILDSSAGIDTVLDFTPGLDRLLVPATGFPGRADALAALRAVSVGSFLPLGSGGVVLPGLDPAAFRASDFDLF
ncbi:calcium-binding protein [Falsiroseomonas selenitidurans]|uniref:Calcium-binding protein n=1 Tax=Falsiroseomonas selenitidurans TaxID=2716335 RepID=A0ABX1DXC3_9PROT|nr:calcium-binding protein [Falsiroseomonas selenitidurans]NKC29531.1 calcium-binding protein [Falsiroseomonas selenitidurans]